MSLDKCQLEIVNKVRFGVLAIDADYSPEVIEFIESTYGTVESAVKNSWWIREELDKYNKSRGE
jgi:hypothetical protein